MNRIFKIKFSVELRITLSHPMRNFGQMIAAVNPSSLFNFLFTGFNVTGSTFGQMYVWTESSKSCSNSSRHAWEAVFNISSNQCWSFSLLWKITSELLRTRENTSCCAGFAVFVLSSIQNLPFWPPGGVANWEWAVWAGELWGNATGRGFSRVSMRPFELVKCE